jgi:cytidylate kinase
MGEKALAGLLRRTNITVSWDRRGMRTLLDGRDVSEEIRAPEVSGFVSEVSAIPAVREKMVAEQRRVAAGHSIVCEGRDIGSVVFPDADLKIFLECDTRERARRRQLELWGQGVSARQSAVQANLEKRDRIDSGREVSPLRRMPDAILVDTTHLTIEEQVAVVCDLARRGVEGSRIRGF